MITGWRSLLVCCVAVFFALASPRSATAQTPRWDPNGLPDFELAECRGRTVSKADLLGQPGLAAFTFTRCAGPCPIVNAEMKKLQEATRDIPLRLVSITVDPARDTPDVLKFHADQLGADPDRWWFLTGDKTDIFKLITGGFRVRVEDDPNPKPGFEVIHSIEIMHVNEQGVVVGRYNARDDVQMARLKRVVLGKLTPEEAQRLNDAPVAPKSDHAGPTSGAEDPSDSEPVGVEIQTLPRPVPEWVLRLPSVNALLNGLATLCLIVGYVLIRRGARSAHASAMISAFITSAVFLGTYLTYHIALRHYTGSGSQPYQGPESLRIPYYCILIPHIALAPFATGLALVTLKEAWKKNWPQHRWLARITFPIWLYVSVTGVIIYLMVYHLPRQSPV